MNYKDYTKELVAKISDEYKIKNNFENLNEYVNIIEEKSKLFNLTGFKGDTLWEKGIYESISMMYQILQKLDFQKKKVLDIGSGVGFPTLPFKIIFPNFYLTIHEPNQKKYDFLNSISDMFDLSVDVKLIRTETIKKREMFDLITARALGSARIIAEVCSRVLKIKGNTFFLKGPKVQEEVDEAQKILKELKFTYKIYENEDPNVQSKLTLLNFTKEAKTSHYYPREWSMIKNNK